MVEGLDKVRAQFAAVAPAITAEVKAEMAKTADDIVRAMSAIKPIPNIEVGWVWGDAPAGAIVVSKTRVKKSDIHLTIYATAHSGKYPAPGNFPAIARWFEFGTEPRTQKKTGRDTGQVTAQPYFFPTWRSWRTTAKRRMTAAVTRAVKKLNK